jgi:hypothetical protein
MYGITGITGFLTLILTTFSFGGGERFSGFNCTLLILFVCGDYCLGLLSGKGLVQLLGYLLDFFPLLFTFAELNSCLVLFYLMLNLFLDSILFYKSSLLNTSEYFASSSIS